MSIATTCSAGSEGGGEGRRRERGREGERKGEEGREGGRKEGDYDHPLHGMDDVVMLCCFFTILHDDSRGMSVLKLPALSSQPADETCTQKRTQLLSATHTHTLCMSTPVPDGIQCTCIYMQIILYYIASVDCSTCNTAKMITFCILPVCLFDLACFSLSSFSSLILKKHVYIHVCR